MKHNLIKKFLPVLLIGSMAIIFTSCDTPLPDTYNYDDFSEYVKVDSYKNLTYDDVQVQVTDEDIQDYIDSDLLAAATTEDVEEGTVADDSKVKVDYEGKLDGKAFDGGSGTDVVIDIADSNFIDGFAEGLVGHEVGDTFDLNLTFPDSYSDADLAGQDTVFTITINALVNTVTPEYDEDFVKNNTDFDTKEDYEADIKKTLTKQKKSDAEVQEKSQVWSEILANSEVKEYPENELSVAKENIISTYKDLAEQNDTEYKDYIKDQMGMSVSDFESQAETSAKSMVKQELVLHYIADKEDIEVSKSDYNDYLDSLLESAGYDRDSYKEATGESIDDYAEENNLYSNLLYDKVMDKVMDYSTIN